MKTVDAKGMLCPKPLILTKKAINTLHEGEGLSIILDNETAKDNVIRFLQDHNFTPEIITQDGVYTLKINSSQVHSIEETDDKTSEYCSVPLPRNKNVVAIKSDVMGNGDNDLGTILMKGFVNTLPEIDPLPSTILFYNNGVKLAVKDSPIIDSLKELDKKGVEILICGTCVDYFGIKNQVNIGVISNMYDILSRLTGASKVITP